MTPRISTREPTMPYEVRLPERDLAALRTLAARNERSVAGEIRMAVRLYLDIEPWPGGLPADSIWARMGEA